MSERSPRTDLGILHDWDTTRSRPTTWDTPVGNGVHESVFRSYQILRIVKEMLDRGDSARTIRSFIAWAEIGDKS